MHAEKPSTWATFPFCIDCYPLIERSLPLHHSQEPNECCVCKAACHGLVYCNVRSNTAHKIYALVGDKPLKCDMKRSMTNRERAEKLASAIEELIEHKAKVITTIHEGFYHDTDGSDIPYSEYEELKSQLQDVIEEILNEHKH